MSSRRLTPGFLRDRAVRYLVPHAAFVVLAALVYLVVTPQEGGVAGWAGRLAWGLALGTTDPIKRACGFSLYWFMPALLCLVALRSALHEAPRWARTGAVLLALCFVGAVGGLDPGARQWLWMGSGIAVYVYPLGLAVAALWSLRTRLGRSALGIAALGVWIGLAVWAWQHDSGVRLARLNVPDVREPLRMAVHLVLPVAALVATVAGSGILARVPGLVVCGRHSLFIYLVHSLVFQVVLRAVPVAERTSPRLVGWAALSLGVTLFVSLGIAIATDRIQPVRRLIAPRTWAEWPPSRIRT